MALNKLEELGYKPRKKPKVEKEEVEGEVETLLQQVEESEAKKRMLNLLVEALSESDPREILIYGMHIKKHLTPIVPAIHRERIAKTLQWLDEAVRLMEKSWRR